MILVIPIVILAILGGTVGEEGVWDDVFLWVTSALLLIMAICLIAGWATYKHRSTSEKPDEDGVL